MIDCCNRGPSNNNDPMAIVAILTTTLPSLQTAFFPIASSSQLVYALDGNTGDTLWTYDPGDFNGSLRIVQGITRDGDGNVYLAFATGKLEEGAHGIIKLNGNGVFQQRFVPSWTFGVNGWVPGIVGYSILLTASFTLYWSPYDDHLYWQHIGRLNGTNKYDCISVLDLSFNELASYGGSNIAPTWTNSLATVPGFPGKIMADSAGNIYNTFGARVGTLSEHLIKITPAGVIVFDHGRFGDGGGFGSTFDSLQAVQPSVRTYSDMQNGASNGHFDINFDNSPPLGQLGMVVSPAFTNIAAGLARRINPWCTSLVDACGTSTTTVPINQMTWLLIADNNLLTDVAATEIVPIAQSSLCAWPFLVGDRFNTNSSVTTSMGTVYTDGRHFVSLRGSDTSFRVGTLQGVVCFSLSGGTINELEAYALMTFDGAGVVTATRTTRDLYGEGCDPAPTIAQAASGFFIGTSYYGPGGLVVGGGYFLDNAGGGNFTVPFKLKGLNAASLSTVWTKTFAVPNPSQLHMITSYADRTDRT